MTNGEKMISAFPNGEVRKCEKGVVFSTGGWCHAYADEWWNAECEEPTTKNNLGVDCISRADAIQAMQDKAKKLTNEDTINGLCGAVAILFDLPSATPQLSIPEVTALAEWTEKLTKASEDAYNKGYADGMKDQELILDKIRAEIDQYLEIEGFGSEYRNDVKGIIDKYKAESEG